MDCNYLASLSTFFASVRFGCLQDRPMSVRICIPGLLVCCLPFLMGCGEKRDHSTTRFTKIDSLTDTYLALQDSMLQSWNIMIKDDNEKLESLHNLLHELQVSGSADQEILKKFEVRLDQLKQSRYTQDNMWEGEIVEEYDFASNALVSELVALAEAQKEFAYNPTLQKLVDQIKQAEQRVDIYREQYDVIASQYNAFIESNHRMLREIDADSSRKKPLFEMVAEENP
jgi:hypothetical protein